jgi:hypothetical protein
MPESILNFPLTRYENPYISLHALEALEDRGLSAFTNIEFSGKNILEVDVIDGSIKNILLEFPFDNRNNLYMAISFKDKNDRSPMGKITVKTVFLRDKYRMDTINKNDEKYYNPSIYQY